MIRLFSTMLLCAGIALAAADYHLSPQGSDANSGTAAKPWQTLAKANAALKAGDTLIVAPGRYGGAIAPANSGAEKSPITYRSAEPGQAILTAAGSERAISLRKKKYIVIDGFKGEVIPGAGWFELLLSEYCTLRNLEFSGATIREPAYCEKANRNRFENLRLERANTIREGFVADDMWNCVNSSFNVFEKLHLGKAGHRPFCLSGNCRNNVVRDSVFDCRWGRNFEYFSSPNVLMERCVIVNGFDGSGSADGRAKLFTVDSIFRCNAVIRNHAAALVFNTFPDENGEALVFRGNRIYNNTFYRNSDAAFELWEALNNPKSGTISDNKFVNNIFAGNNPGGSGFALRIEGDLLPDNRFAGNLFYGGGPGDKTIRINTGGRARFLSAAEADREFPVYFKDNFEAVPGFRDATNDDFALKPGSPASGRALPLTTVSAPSQGDEITVGDARFFFDGFGIPGEKGDLIKIGDAEARIVKRDLKKNTLKLDRALTVKSGMEIRSAVNPRDQGAYPGGPAIAPETRMPTMADADKPVWRADFEPATREEWHSIWNYTRQRNSSARIEPAGGVGGGGALVVFATADGSTLSTNTIPPEWNAERFPLIRFQYQIKPGTPVGVALMLFDTARRQNDNLYLGGSPGYQAGNFRDLKQLKLEADGRWHRCEIDLRPLFEHYPELKRPKGLRFYTQGNGRKNDEYRIDDFSLARP